MSTGKIYIVCHKPSDVPSDEVYTPIQVGRKTSNYSLDMTGDDIGDNISERNSTFCEMTAQYWVWKNVHDVDYVGFCHYRRFFNMKFSAETFATVFSDGTDVILSSPQYRRRTMQHHWLMYICSEDITIMLRVVHKLYPDYDPIIEKYLIGVKYSPFNMLICKKELFDDYCSWLFSILFECEKYIKLSPYSRGRRVFGYMAEFLMPLYFIKNKHKIKYLDVVYKSETGDVVWKPRWQEKVVCIFTGLWSRVVYKKPYMYDWAHIYALQHDGIQIE